MSGRRRHGRRIQHRFVGDLYHHVINSEQFLVTTSSEKVAYLYLLADKKRDDQVELKLTYKQAERFMERHTFSRAMKGLIAKGFIDVVRHGGGPRTPAVYKLSDRWRDLASAK